MRQIEDGLGESEQVFVTAADIRDGLISDRLPGLKPARDEARLPRDQRAALEASLPSPEEVAGAEAKAAELVKRANAERAKFAESWSTFLAVLTEAESAAREVVASRVEAQPAIHDVVQLREQYDLDVKVPPVPKPTTAEAKLAGTLGTLLRNVGYSQVIDQLLDSESAKARRQVEREAA